MPDTFEDRIQQAMQRSVMSLIEKGDWCKIDYAARVDIKQADLREMFARVDMKKVFDLVLANVEEMIATKIVHAMATELSTDIKKILSNNELREDLRATLREKIRTGAETLS